MTLELMYSPIRVGLFLWAQRIAKINGLWALHAGFLRANMRITTTQPLFVTISELRELRISELSGAEVWAKTYYFDI